MSHRGILIIVVGLTALCAVFAAQQAQAVPYLQLFINSPNAQYVPEPEGPISGSWVTSEKAFELWAVGNTSFTRILGAKIATAYSSVADDGVTPINQNVQITITPVSAAGLTNYSPAGVWDLAAAAAVTQTNFGDGGAGGDYVDESGDPPLFGSGFPLPDHGVYGPNVWWQQFELGDMGGSMPNSPVANDRITEFDGDIDLTNVPVAEEGWGEINAYMVEITNLEGWLHLDLYDTLEVFGTAKIGTVGDPDADVVPETSSVLLWCMIGGVFSIGCWFRHRRQIPC